MIRRTLVPGENALLASNVSTGDVRSDLTEVFEASFRTPPQLTPAIASVLQQVQKEIATTDRSGVA